MNRPYTRQQLIEDYYNDVPLKYIFFWGHTAQHDEGIGKYCFSQWFELPFTVAGISYLTAEHWMMARKAILFEDRKVYEQIIKANSAAQAKELGRFVKNFDEMVWRTHRFDIVVQGNIHKFNQHPHFAEYLLRTGDRVLAEASPRDQIWGVGLSQDNEEIANPDNWRGENLLGFALMEARDFFKENGHFEPIVAAVKVPWAAHPDIHPNDLFWNMGDGEDLIEKFWNWYNNLDGKSKMLFKLTNPVPYNWRDDFDFY